MSNSSAVINSCGSGGCGVVVVAAILCNFFFVLPGLLLWAGACHGNVNKRVSITEHDAVFRTYALASQAPVIRLSARMLCL